MTKLRILILQNHWPILNIFGRIFPWIKGIEFCPNKGARLNPRGDNNKIAKIHLNSLGLFQQNLAQSILGWRIFNFVQTTGSAFFQGEIITQLRKYNDDVVHGPLLFQVSVLLSILSLHYSLCILLSIHVELNQYISIK